MKKRLFLAIDLPSKIKEQIGEVISELKKKYPQIRWERKENLHLTLKFLGWVGDQLKTQKSKVKTTTQKSKGEEIIEGMEKATQGIKTFWFQPTKIGYFLNQNLIIWLGVKSQEGLFKLVENLEGEMKKIGFPKEKRPFAPHITLGRGRVGTASQERLIAQELQNLGTKEFGQFKVEQIVLMESHLTPSGSIYTPLKTQNLIF